MSGIRKATKYQIASLLARVFPELPWRLPPSRKAWQPERWNMLLSDAATLGMSYLAMHNDESVIQKLAFAS